MTVKELIELNQMITDIEITVRVNGTALLDQLNIGCSQGRKPPFPTKVPIDERYVGNTSKTKEACYIEKSINSWDDGKDYWQVKLNRIPKKWLNFVACSWGVWPASSVGVPRRMTGNAKNVSFHGQRLNITVLPDGEKLDISEPVSKKSAADEQLEGQMSIEDLYGWIG